MSFPGRHGLVGWRPDQTSPWAITGRVPTRSIVEMERGAFSVQGMHPITNKRARLNVLRRI
jgi:hypothetical protein